MRVAHHNPDDVRSISKIGKRNKAWENVSGERTGVSMECGDLCHRVALGSASPALYAGPYWRDHLPKYVFVFCDCQGFFPTTGYGTDGRKYSGSPGYFLPHDAGEIKTIYRHHHERPSG